MHALDVCDHFNDGSFTDVSPLSWKVNWPTWEGTYKIIAGDLVMTNGPTGLLATVNGLNPTEGDISVRTRVRLEEASSPTIWAVARGSVAQP